MFFDRYLFNEVRNSLQNNPVTAIIGPRQCGKSTLARQLMSQMEHTLYLDLERPSDLAKIEDAEWFLSMQTDKLVCIDEIQRKPEIFPVLRSLVDEKGRNGMYIILGSASRELLKQSSESLAGRISYKILTPFLWSEVSNQISLESYIVQGGFPRSILAVNDHISFDWRQDFISTFLERDLLQFSGFVPQTMHRLWQMLAHYNAQPINYSAIAGSLGVSHSTIRNYVDLLNGTFMLYQLYPFHTNLKKRIVKAPKVYLSDTGILTALLKLESFEQSSGHPGFGSLWETLVYTNIKGHFPEFDISFYRTSHGAEIDFIVSYKNIHIAVECKASLTPVLTRGNYSALEDIQPYTTYVAAPVRESYSLKKGIEVVSISDLIERLGKAF
jgi:predicted AAA+ superfamily ATPase